MNRLPTHSAHTAAGQAGRVLAAILFGTLGAMPLASAQHTHAGHTAAPAPAPAAAAAPAADPRQVVSFPAPMKDHTLANMRDHLVALAQIQAALASGAFEQAAQVAEQRLGMSSLATHGAHDVARYMPQGMQAAGSAMHRSASQFALEAQNSAATGDLKPALAALARTTQTCTACHAAYRMR